MTSAFSEAELDYLRSGAGEERAHLALGDSERTHVMPVSFRYNAAEDAIEIGAPAALHIGVHLSAEEPTDAELVIGDLASIEPWRPRGIEVQGTIETLRGPPGIRIVPRRVRSWGLEQRT
ncbi:MAG: hypothetical protein ABR536_03445 [Solirubrobacterales bacterium]